MIKVSIKYMDTRTMATKRTMDTKRIYKRIKKSDSIFWL